MSEALRRVLSAEYGGAYIDEAAHREEGTAEDGTLTGWYTTMFVTVDGVNRLWVHFGGHTLPAGGRFDEVAASRRCEWKEWPARPREFSIFITIRDAAFLRELADTFPILLLPREQDRKPWHYRERRNAATLRRLADLLDRHRDDLERHGEPGPDRQGNLPL
jgi:hypothetical protein